MIEFQKFMDYLHEASTELGKVLTQYSNINQDVISQIKKYIY